MSDYKPGENPFETEGAEAPLSYQAGESPFAEAAPSEDIAPGVNPFKQAKPKNESQSFLEHMGGLLQNANMTGAIPESAIPSRPLDQMAIGAAMAVNHIEDFIRGNPFDKNDPKTQARLATLASDRRVAGEVIKDIQKDDSVTARFVGDALQSIPGSSPGILAAAIPGVNVAGAMAIGLGSNMLLETAGDMTKRVDEFGQTREEAFPSAAAHGAVATALEALPMGAAVKHLKVGGQVMPMLGKVGAGEFAQEAGTRLFDDVLTNEQGFTNYTPGEMAKNAGAAGLTGVIMAPMMGGMAHTVNRVQSWDRQRQIEKAVARENWEDTTAGQEMQAAMMKVLSGAADVSTVPIVPVEEPTLEERQTAAIVKQQMTKGLDVPDIPSESADVITGSIMRRLDEGILASDALDEGGISPEVLERRRSEYQAMRGNPGNWRIIHSRDERAVGLTPRQLGELPAGAVVSVGMNDENYPAEVFNPLMETIGKFVDKYIPGSRVVIVQAPFAPEHQANAFGLHWMEDTSEGPIHFIVPREMTNIGRHGVSDLKTASAFLGSVTHEFGHAVEAQGLWDMLSESVGVDLARQALGEIRNFALTPETLSQLEAVAPEEAALFSHWNTLQQAVRDGKLSAVEFVEQWAGIRKLGGSVAKTLDSNKSLYDWAQARAKEAGLPWDGLTAAELLSGKRLGRMGKRDWQAVNEYLGFHEFMAEQFSRAAYVRGDVAKSKLGKFFQSTLTALRDLFRTLKTTKQVDGTTIIAPHVTFEAWLDKLTLRGKSLPHPKGRVKLTKEMKKKQAAILRKEKLLQEVKKVVEDTPEVVEEPPEQVPPSKADEMSYSAEELGDMLQDAIDRGMVEPEQMQHRRIRGMIKRGQLVEARMALEEIMDELAKWRSTPHWDKEYVSKVLSRLPDKATLKAQTVRDTLRQADIRQAERSVYEQFLAQNAGRDTFTRDELAELVQNNILPLSAEESREWSTYGLEGIGVPEADADSSARTVIWKAPPEVKVVNSSHHFSDAGYLMHHREVVLKGVPFVVEMQSDVFQKGVTTLSDEQTRILEEAVSALQNEQSPLYSVIRRGVATPEQEARYQENTLRIAELSRKLHVRKQEAPATEALGQVWEKRLVEEILALAASEGRTRVMFAAADTMVAVEGWSHIAQIAELEGMVVEQNATAYTLTGKVMRSPARADQTWDMYLLDSTVGLPVTFGVEDGEIIGVDVGAEAAAKLAVEKGKAADFTYGDMQTIYDRYTKDLPKIFKGLNGKLVTDGLGFAWWEVSTQATKERVFAWDKDNPMTPNMPGVELAEFAGMAVEDYRKPEVIAQAAGMWQRLGFDSPFFKRWFGDSQIRDAFGEPMALWRGDNNKVTYLDSTLRGSFTGAQSAKKAFWFSNARANAEWYATESVRGMQTVLTPEANRQAQAIRQKIERTKELIRHPELDKEHRNLLHRKLQELRDKVAALEGNVGLQQQAVPHIGQYYLRMENPLVVDMGWGPYDAKQWDQLVQKAVREGHDGLVLKHTYDPLEGDMYAVFSPEQVKAKENAGTFDPTDMLHWDSDGQTQQAAKETVKMLGNFMGLNKLRMHNFAAKVIDSMMQLQQVAASQPEDVVLNTFVRLIGRANQMKSDLQFPAEEVGQKMVKSTPHTVNELHRVLREEWKSGVLMGDLVGVDAEGQVVWGREVGMSPTQREQVVNWQIVPGERLLEFFNQHGVNVETPAGKKIVELYLDTRNTFLHQWKGLEIALKEKAERLYGNAPTVLRSEHWNIEQLVNKYRVLPFLPQGFFGNYVVLVQKQRSWEEAKEDNRRRFVTVKRLHFESKAEAQQAFKQLRGLESSGEYRVRTREIKEGGGIPMQLPREFLEHVAATADFTDEQIEELADLMVVSNYEKIDARYAKITERIEGGNEDFKRVFANFTWHNANYIWKAYFRTSMQHMISVARSEVRALERGDLPAEEIVAQVDRKRRNIRMMEQSLDYMMHPQQEFQRAKLAITLTYLAFNIKTALMNLSTQLNTYAAVTSEYGEIAGHKAYAKGLFLTASLPWHSQLRDTAKSDAEAREMNEIIAITDLALREGVIDQSYAYFLAGQANASGALLSTSNSWIGKGAHIVSELGMLPFRVTEKANRYSTLYTVYLAERRAGKDVNAAYQRAVESTNLLQNAYDAGNKPQLLRGKKSILLMFASYTQFQGWIMLGGYERAQRARALSEGRNIAPVWRSTTMKLWLIYLMLGGLMGVPFAQNLMDILQFIWRKLFGNTENLTDELMDFVRGLGLDQNMAMHGLFHNVGGFDLSGSFGMGRMLPGVDMLNRTYNSVDEALGKGVTTFAGPAGGFYSDLSKALVAFGGGKWNEGFKEFPGAMGAVAKATDALVKQNLKPDEGMGATLKDGTRMTRDPVTGEFRDLTLKEIAGMALGATPMMVSQNRERAFAEQGEYLYWLSRRQELKKNYLEATLEGDEKGRESAREAIDRFNDNLPSNTLRINGKELADGLRARRKGMQQKELHGTGAKRFRGVVGDISENY